MSERNQTDGCSSVPDRAGNLLELVVLATIEGDQLVIHAMPMRPKYETLLKQ